MHTSPEITLDMTAADLLDDTCIEVDDIAALDPALDTLTVPVAKAAKAAPAVAQSHAEETYEIDSLEFELSADDMNALFDAEATDKVR